jgi:hypothetical protein
LLVDAERVVARLAELPHVTPSARAEVEDASARSQRLARGARDVLEDRHDPLAHGRENTKAGGDLGRGAHEAQRC